MPSFLRRLFLGLVLSCLLAPAPGGQAGAVPQLSAVQDEGGQEGSPDDPQGSEEDVSGGSGDEAPGVGDEGQGGDPGEEFGIDEVDVDVDPRVTVVAAEMDWRERWVTSPGRNRSAVVVVALDRKGRVLAQEERVEWGRDAGDESLTVRLRGEGNRKARRAVTLLVTTTQSFDEKGDEDRLFERNVIDTQRVEMRSGAPRAAVSSWADRDCRSEVIRPGADLNYCRISGAWLPGADLSGTRLRRAEIRASNFSGARLVDAALEFSTVTGTRFDGANMTRAKLGGAEITALSNLMHVTFVDADLESTKISWTSLAHADLTGARTRDWSTIGVSMSFTRYGSIVCAWYAIDGWGCWA